MANNCQSYRALLRSPALLRFTINKRTSWKWQSRPYADKESVGTQGKDYQHPAAENEFVARNYVFQIFRYLINGLDRVCRMCSSLFKGQPLLDGPSIRTAEFTFLD